MKKTLLIIAALIISGFVSAQQMIKVENPEPTDRDGWIGNTVVDYMSVMENTIMVMAPRQIEPDISGTITSVKFYHYEYEEYNTRSYTLKIYEDINLQLYDEYMNYYYFESCGNEVYSQDFTVEQGQGWRTVELDTPYNIPEGEFWVGIKMNGEGMMLYGNNANSVRGQYYYSDRYEWVWYWKPSMFMVNWEELLFSNAMAVYVEDGQSVDENVAAAANNVCVYPNPAEGFVNVKAEGLKNVELIDMMGRVISRNESSEAMTTIDLSNLTSGIYFLRVTTEAGVSLQRITVK